MNRDDFLKTERLYHFTNRCSALKILETGSLKFGKLKQMNDINESYREVFTKEGVEPEKVEEELNKYKQISLTHDGRLLGFAIPSMWGHYAEKGYGICFVFDKTKLLNTISGDCYGDDIHYSFDYDNSIKIDKDDIESSFKENIKDLFFTKTIDWEYEQEFRIITKSSNDVLEYKDSLIAVIMYFAEDIPNNKSALGSTMAKLIGKIAPDLSILEFGYWDEEPNLRNEQCEQWYPKAENPKYDV